MDNFLHVRWNQIVSSSISLMQTQCSTAKVDFDSLSKDEYKQEEEKLKRKADALLASRTFAWEPINYTEYVGKQYLVEGMMPEYAVLNRIFYEIAARCPDFRPHSLFDLASGVGTVSL